MSAWVLTYFVTTKQKVSGVEVIIMATPGTSNGRFSRKQAITIYLAFLEEFGAKIEDQKDEQYADSIEGTLQGKKFKFRIHHNKDGEFSKIDWQKISREDFQEIKALFDKIKGIIISGIEIAKKVKSLPAGDIDRDALASEMDKLKV